MFGLHLAQQHDGTVLAVVWITRDGLRIANLVLAFKFLGFQLEIMNLSVEETGGGLGYLVQQLTTGIHR